MGDRSGRTEGRESTCLRVWRCLQGARLAAIPSLVSFQCIFCVPLILQDYHHHHVNNHNDDYHNHHYSHDNNHDHHDHCQLPHVWLKRHENDQYKSKVKADAVDVDYLYSNAFESKDAVIINYVDEPPVFEGFAQNKPKPKKPNMKPRLQVVEEPRNEPTEFQTLMLGNVAVEQLGQSQLVA